MSESVHDDVLAIEQRGDLTIIVPSSRLETLDAGVTDEMAPLLLDLLRRAEMPLVIIDLERADYFGSSFLSLLLRCWRQVQLKGGQMALAGVSKKARDLLRITSLDILWPIYDDRLEAIRALQAE